MMMMVERREAAQASAKRERRRAGMSAANVGASVSINTHSKCVFFSSNHQYWQEEGEGVVRRDSIYRDICMLYVNVLFFWFFF